ncbi:proteasome assembly chaperone 3-like [Uloborus diversus]|uniref:proteasome assembly chaperone 3-like n=1 Tax=Uloborus diversus TaxID=327109 RepID=UPI0024099AA9|nr:proteasome assembly chaperone 3-like [Uloborus diversus]
MDEKKNVNIKFKSAKGDGNGQVLNIVITEFSDKFFIILTSCGKIGSLIQVFSETTISEESTSIINSKALFGKDEPEIHAFARSLVENLNFTKPVVFGFSLKDYTMSAFTDIKNLIFETMKKL